MAKEESLLGLEQPSGYCDAVILAKSRLLWTSLRQRRCGGHFHGDPHLSVTAKRGSEARCCPFRCQLRSRADGPDDGRLTGSASGEGRNFPISDVVRRTFWKSKAGGVGGGRWRASSHTLVRPPGDYRTKISSPCPILGSASLLNMITAMAPERALRIEWLTMALAPSTGETRSKIAASPGPTV